MKHIPQIISRKNWFEHLVGFSEPDWNFELDTLPPHITNHMGSFTLISLHDLKKQTRMNPMNTKQILPLYVITRSDWTLEHKFDTSSLQYDAEPDTVFQVASNFNCLEVSSTTDNPLNGKYLSFLMEDTTQGPSASGGAVCGAFQILNKHFESPISLLEDVCITDKNGKLMEEKVSQEQVDKLSTQQQHIKVGILRNTHPVINRNATLGDTIIYTPQDTHIHQVFTSTCIVRRQSKKSLELQEILLRVAYEAVYLLAIQEHSHNIVLTMVGGGVFRNDRNTIIRIISETHKKYSCQLHPHCRVEIPIYVPQKTNRIINQFKTHLGEHAHHCRLT